MTITGETRACASRHFCPRGGSLVFARGSDAPNQFIPDNELWTNRRATWLPKFPVKQRFERDRQG